MNVAKLLKSSIHQTELINKQIIDQQIFTKKAWNKNINNYNNKFFKHLNLILEKNLLWGKNSFFVAVGTFHKQIELVC